jgi:enoyl-CoA hydratase/carnithine racemase
LTAKQAEEWGIVNKVVPDDQLEEETMRWANMISLHSTDGLVNSKIYKQIALDMLGCGPSLTPLSVTHTLFTNLRWREDELNFLKLRTLVGTTEAFRQREERWANLGFPKVKP